MAPSPRILVGANLSEHGDEAIRQADAWARTHGWELLVCHVAPSPLGVHMLFPQLTEQEVLAEPEKQLKLERALRDHVARLTGHEPDKLRAIIETGAPDAQLIHQAEQQRVEVVVVGSHSHSGLKQIFLGDVAESVVRHAVSSVLVARPHRPTRRILFATSFSEEATAAARLAAEHARLSGAHLIAACNVERRMEVIREMTNFGAAYGFVQDEFDDTRRSSEKRLTEQLASIGVAAEVMVLDGAAAPAIVHAASETDADLIVIGAGSFGRGHILHSVAEKVAHAAPCSVLVVRESAEGL